MRKLLAIGLLGFFFLCACNKSRKEEDSAIVKEWVGKKMVFPNGLEFFQYDGKQTDYVIPKSKYKVVVYVDSLDCTECELRLLDWKHFIDELNGCTVDVMPVLFFLRLRDKKSLDKFYSYLKEEEFLFPISIDSQGMMDRHNHFPNSRFFRTFLLDVDDNVVLIGNPIHNPKMKDLYKQTICGKVRDKHSFKLTEVAVLQKQHNMGSFDWQQEQKATFSLQNVGKQPLIVQDVTTSCGCTSVEYSKEPVLLGKSLDIKVTYKADHPEHFNKTIFVYCNSTSSPMQLKIMGDAREME